MENKQTHLFLNLDGIKIDEFNENKSKYLELITSVNEQISKNISEFLLKQKKIQRHVIFIEDNKISDPKEKILGIFPLPKFLQAINTEDVEDIRSNIVLVKEGNTAIQESINLANQQIKTYLENLILGKEKLEEFHSLKKQEEKEDTSFSQSIEDFLQQIDVKIDNFNYLRKLIFVTEEISNKQIKFVENEEKRLNQEHIEKALSSFNKLSNEMDNVLDKQMNNQNKNN